MRVLGSDDVVEAFEIGFRGSQAEFGLAPASVQPGDARGFLEQMPPVDGLRADDSADFAWLTSADERAPLVASANIVCTSRARVSRPFTRNVEPPPRSMRRATSVSSSPSPALTSARHTSATSLGGDRWSRRR